jgi:hypothetical protein
MEALERMQRTFAEIIQPTWGSVAIPDTGCESVTPVDSPTVQDDNVELFEAVLSSNETDTESPEAPTHLKRADNALSARNMSKFPTKPNKPFFGVLANVVDEHGKPVYSPDGKLLKNKVPMADAQFADGTPQSLYFPEGHEKAGIFKGMAVILEERGFVGMDKL